MSGFHDNVLLGASGSQGYQISRSVRLRSSASAYFNRTLTTPTDAKKWTWSGWVKRGILGASPNLFWAWSGSGNEDQLMFSTDTLRFYVNGGTTGNIITSAVFRDPSSWYHIIAVYDSANATSNDRMILYVNGVRQALSTNTQPTLNYSNQFNTAVSHSLGRNVPAATYFDGYLTEVNFIDGQALTPSSFGETDAVTGVWKPKKYNGTYGTNGFYLNFSDNSAATAAAIGKDYSGNGNNWTPNNISVTAGATYDSMLDVPTQWADGGNGRGNYSVANPVNAASGLTVSDGNLKIAASAGGSKFVNASIALPSSGAYYAEITFANATTNLSGASVGIQSASRSLTGAWNATGSYTFYGTNAAVMAANGTTTASGLSAISANEVFQVAVDVTNSKMWIGRSNVWYNSTGGTTGDPATGANPTFTGSFADFFIYSGFDTGSAVSANFNFGQRPFAYTPPSGFKALNTLNLPTPPILKGNQYFDAVTYAGSASQQTITTSLTGLDLAWIKNRTAARDHVLVDTVRGGSPLLTLYSDLTAAEDNSSPNYNPTSFTTSGIVLGGAKLGINNAGENFVLWGWKEGATQGFDIVTYTGNGTTQNVAHSLGVAPKMVIVKQRSAAGNSWGVWHTGLTSAGYAVFLNQTIAQDPATSYWNSTAPTSSVFTVGSSAMGNANGSTYVAYLFAEVAGFSKFGSYTGNGSTDGPFVFCGFRPRWVMFKRTDATSNWVIVDTARSTYNETTVGIVPNSSSAETTGVGNYDILSNGFKCRNVIANEANVSGGTYIFAAFAENPFKNALAR